MAKKGAISLERAIELEIWLIENCSVGMNNHELLCLLETENFNRNEMEYLINAYYMPMFDISKQITIYDTECSHMDEITFISRLKTKYNCDSSVIIKRIRYIRAINKYLRNNPNVVFPDVQFYDKLVRDNIPDIIESKGEKAIYHTLSDEEYWDYLLKKDSEELEELRKAGSREEIKEELSDKLELIRAMAAYLGFTLDDIIKEANLKREIKGGFTKKLVLERTFKPLKKDN